VVLAVIALMLDTDELPIRPVDDHRELRVRHPKVEWNEVHRNIMR
jgi:hypothetical protein